MGSHSSIHLREGDMICVSPNLCTTQRVSVIMQSSLKSQQGDLSRCLP